MLLQLYNVSEFHLLFEIYYNIYNDEIRIFTRFSLNSEFVIAIYIVEKNFPRSEFI